MILSSGWCAWLKAAPQELARRISLDAASASSRPPLSRLGVLGEIESILRERQPLYEEVANAQYETESISLESLVDHIAIDYNTWLDEIPS
jgi:shikimate kinase